MSICLLSTLPQSRQPGKLKLDLGQKGDASVTAQAQQEQEVQPGRNKREY